MLSNFHYRNISLVSYNGMVNVSPRLGLVVCLSALGCFPGKVVGTSDATSIGDSTGADSTTSDAESTSSESSTGDGDGDPGPSETGEDTDTTIFVVETDFTTCSVCDEIAQDCPEGEKCTPGDYRGSCGPPSCKPIIGDLPPGEACTIVDGVDDCDESSWCYPGQIGLDEPSQCIEFCQGSIDNSSCSDPTQVCVADRLVYEGPLGCR